MHQIDSKTVIRESDHYTTPLRRKILKIVFKKDEHSDTLNKNKGMKFAIKKTITEPNLIREPAGADNGGHYTQCCKQIDDFPYTTGYRMGKEPMTQYKNGDEIE